MVAMLSRMCCLLRQDGRQQWGFWLQGGRDQGHPLTIHQVGPNSIADIRGLRSGDTLIQIGRERTVDMTHVDAQNAVQRAGNRLDLLVLRPANLEEKAILLPTKEEKAPIRAIVHKQSNSPLGLYSPENVADTFIQQTRVLTKGAINLQRKPQTVGPHKMQAKSDVYRMVHEEDSSDEYTSESSSNASPTPTNRNQQPIPPPKPVAVRPEQHQQQVQQQQQRVVYSQTTTTTSSSSSSHSQQQQQQQQQLFQEQQRQEQERQRQLQLQQQERQRQQQLQQQQQEKQRQEQERQRQQQLQQQQQEKQRQEQERQRQQQLQQQQQQEKQRQEQERQRQQQLQQQQDRQRLEQERQRQEQERQRQQQSQRQDQERQRQQQLQQQDRQRQEQERLRQQQLQQEKQRQEQERLRQQQQQYRAPEEDGMQSRPKYQPYPQQHAQPNSRPTQGSTFQTNIPFVQNSSPTPNDADSLNQIHWSPTTGRRRPVWPPVKQEPALSTSSQSMKFGGGRPSKQFIWPPPKDFVEVTEELQGNQRNVIYRHVAENEANKARVYVSPRAPAKLAAEAWEPYSGAQDEQRWHKGQCPTKRLRRFDDIFASNSTPLPPTYRAPPGSSHIIST